MEGEWSDPASAHSEVLWRLNERFGVVGLVVVVVVCEMVFVECLLRGLVSSDCPMMME